MLFLHFIKRNLRTKPPTKSSYKINITMENAYFRYLDGAEHFEMVLKFKDPTLGVDRRFNFKRQLSETVESFLGRIAVSIEKVIAKKSKKKKGREATEPAAGICVELLSENNRIDRNLTCKDVFKKNSKLQLKIMDNILNIRINAPWIDRIALPNSILAGFPVYPTRFESIFTCKDKCLFTWYRSLLLKSNWMKVGEGYLFTPSSEDIGHYLKLICLPANQDAVGPEIEVESSVVVEKGPENCPFETRHTFTTERLSENKFRVVTYNILADIYCDSDHTREFLFPYCPPSALAIDYRKQLFLKELIGYNADIMCLQEVDEKVYDLDLLPVFSRLGYKSVFSKKGGLTSEGLACIYNSKRFKTIETDSIILGEEISSNPVFGEFWKGIKSNSAFCERLLPRPTALQITTLQSMDNAREILLIANTHLYFHPDADHVRLFQGALSISYIEHTAKKLKMQYPTQRISVIFCGDFNSVPECGIFRLYTTGTVPSDFKDWSSNEKETLQNVSLSQPFKLKSACGTPKYTNFTAEFADCLDYIFYQTDSLSVKQMVPLPSVEKLKVHTALPSIVFPSDHISLVADLEWQS